MTSSMQWAFRWEGGGWRSQINSKAHRRRFSNDVLQGPVAMGQRVSGNLGNEQADRLLDLRRHMGSLEFGISRGWQGKQYLDTFRWTTTCRENHLDLVDRPDEGSTSGEGEGLASGRVKKVKQYQPFDLSCFRPGGYLHHIYVEVACMEMGSQQPIGCNGQRREWILEERENSAWGASGCCCRHVSTERCRTVFSELEAVDQAALHYAELRLLQAHWMRSRNVAGTRAWQEEAFGAAE